MTLLRTIGISGLLGFRALFAWNTPGLFVTSLLLTPTLQILFFVALGQALSYQDPAFFIVGNGIQVAATAGIAGMVSVIADERRFGTLSMVLGSPGSRVAVFVGRMLPGVVCGFIVASLTSVVGLALVSRPLDPPQFLLYMLAIIVAAVSCSAMGLALSACGLVYRDIFQIATAAYLLTMVVSGANIDRSTLPEWTRILGDALPTTHAIDAVRAMLDGQTVRTALASVALEGCVAAVWVAVALVLMKLFERVAKRRDALDLY
jgi:ABC-2 type transport system permease protein